MKLTVHDVLGKEVAQLVKGEQKAGLRDVFFDGTRLASGVYYYRLNVTPINGEVGSFVETKKFVLLK